MYAFGKKTTCYPNLKTIARIARLQPTTVSTLLSDLVKREYIRRRRRGGRGTLKGGASSNEYELLFKNGNFGSVQNNRAEPAEAEAEAEAETVTLDQSKITDSVTLDSSPVTLDSSKENKTSREEEKIEEEKNKNGRFGVPKPPENSERESSKRAEEIPIPEIIPSELKPTAKPDLPLPNYQERVNRISKEYDLEMELVLPFGSVLSPDAKPLKEPLSGEALKKLRRENTGIYSEASWTEMVHIFHQLRRNSKR
jgi:predicted transcriptional regulator